MGFSENLQFYRKRENITQEQLAEKMEVSRQTISKWEAGTTFPEMEKLLLLCDMFSCSMDTLMRGNARDDVKEDTDDYDRHMNQFGIRITAGVALILTGTAVYEFGEAFGVYDKILNGTFMIFALVAVIIFIVTGMQHEIYAKRHPVIQPFYEKNILESFERKFPVFVGTGVGTILAGVIAEQVIEATLKGTEGGALAAAIFMLFVTVGVSLLIYGGLQKEKYDIEAYNKKNNPDKSEKRKNELIGAVCGIIMIIATAVYLILGFGYARWETAPIVYATGGLLCGIVVIIINNLHIKK